MMKANDKIPLACPEEGGSGAVYLRSATAEHGGGASLDFQRKVVLELSESLGVSVAADHVFSEVGSGLSLDRPGLQAVWDLVESKEIRHVLAYDTDRLGRNPLDVLRFVRHCKEHGVLLHFAEDYR